jgi:hypothetical protein
MARFLPVLLLSTSMNSWLIMPISSAPASNSQIWDSLKRAISQSSGFQGWVIDRAVTADENSLDMLIHRYLREALETLAY